MKYMKIIARALVACIALGGLPAVAMRPGQKKPEILTKAAVEAQAKKLANQDVTRMSKAQFAQWAAQVDGFIVKLGKNSPTAQRLAIQLASKRMERIAKKEQIELLALFQSIAHVDEQFAPEKKAKWYSKFDELLNNVGQRQFVALLTEVVSAYEEELSATIKDISSQLQSSPLDPSALGMYAPANWFEAVELAKSGETPTLTTPDRLLAMSFNIYLMTSYNIIEKTYEPQLLQLQQRIRSAAAVYNINLVSAVINVAIKEGQKAVSLSKNSKVTFPELEANLAGKDIWSPSFGNAVLASLLRFSDSAGEWSDLLQRANKAFNINMPDQEIQAAASDVAETVGMLNSFLTALAQPTEKVWLHADEGRTIVLNASILPALQTIPAVKQALAQLQTDCINLTQLTSTYINNALTRIQSRINSQPLISASEANDIINLIGISSVQAINLGSVSSILDDLIGKIQAVFPAIAAQLNGANTELLRKVFITMAQIPNQNTASSMSSSSTDTDTESATSSTASQLP